MYFDTWVDYTIEYYENNNLIIMTGSGLSLRDFNPQAHLSIHTRYFRNLEGGAPGSFGTRCSWMAACTASNRARRTMNLQSMVAATGCRYVFNCDTCTINEEHPEIVQSTNKHGKFSRKLTFSRFITKT